MQLNLCCAEAAPAQFMTKSCLHFLMIRV